MDTRFEYKVLPVNKLEIELSACDPRARESGQEVVNGGKAITGIIIDGERIKPTGRFWESLYARFGLNTAFFKFFDHNEVFQRIGEKESNDRVRVCIERGPTGDARLLAATSPTKPILIYDDLQDVLHQFGADPSQINYAKGVVTSTHTPRTGAGTYNIGGDAFQNKFILHAPVDGYGSPSFYLSMLRLLCTNGMTGFANQFRTTLQLGSNEGNVLYTLKRALEGFSNEDGYAQMRDRFEASMQSWASIREQMDLYSVLLRSGAAAGGAMLSNFLNMTGRPEEQYKLDPNLFTPKRIRSLPVECKVYDLLNFATEIATHHVGPESERRLQAWVGGMLSGEYDLEGSCDHFDDFRDFFLKENRQKFEATKEKSASDKPSMSDDDE